MVLTLAVERTSSALSGREGLGENAVTAPVKCPLHLVWRQHASDGNSGYAALPRARPPAMAGFGA